MLLFKKTIAFTKKNVALIYFKILTHNVLFTTFVFFWFVLVFGNQPTVHNGGVSRGGSVVVAVGVSDVFYFGQCTLFPLRQYGSPWYPRSLPLHLLP